MKLFEIFTIWILINLIKSELLDKNKIPKKVEAISTVKKTDLKENKEENIDTRSLLESNEFKLFNSNYGDTKIIIGILSMPVHGKIRRYLRRKGISSLSKDMLYKQDLIRDKSLHAVSWIRKRSKKYAKGLLKKMRKYSYYPTSYAKALFGWNIFDYLVEKNGDPLVKLIRQLEMIQFLKKDIIN